ncbi:hypothetical protein J6590_039328 [Homalodisca vitripennis]|nr:hypothetical protein J6590_039328 [Homalodisca vitripennis]
MAMSNRLKQNVHNLVIEIDRYFLTNDLTTVVEHMYAELIKLLNSHFAEESIEAVIFKRLQLSANCLLELGSDNVAGKMRDRLLRITQTCHVSGRHGVRSLDVTIQRIR